ncbi:permease [uncultured Clostridium sp.]|uniref:permease n=1 Tax=uncultured Clostridium sp. TaxID=59620 RepID=UPI0025D361DD|nr:permease [uncultured Clostridium sp.]
MRGIRGISVFIAGAFILVSAYVYKVYNIDFSIHEIGDFATIFTSIILDAFPFIIIGSFVSAFIQIFVSQDIIERFIPRSTALGYIAAGLIGLIFPVCECAIVPITRRLISKGVPVGLGVTFMLSVPIVNPVVIMSTYYAFYDVKSMVFVRTIGGFACAVIIGMIMEALCREDMNIISGNADFESMCNCGCSMPMEEGKSKIISLIEHTNRELLEIARYLILGAFLSGIFQVVASHKGFEYISENKVLVIVFMMFLGFALSLCSEADAFVGKTFYSTYSFSSIAAFLLIGPMLDLKNLMMLSGGFKKEFVSKLSFVTLGIVFIVSCIFMMCGA